MPACLPDTPASTSIRCPAAWPPRCGWSAAFIECASRARNSANQSCYCTHGALRLVPETLSFARACSLEVVRAKAARVREPPAQRSYKKALCTDNSNVTLFAGLNLGRADSVGRGCAASQVAFVWSSHKANPSTDPSIFFFAGQPRSKSNHRSRANCVLVHMIQTRE